MATFALLIADLFSVQSDKGLALSVMAAFTLALFGLLGIAGIIVRLTIK